MRPPVRHLLLSLLAALPACGDLQVRYVPPPQVVPAALEGEWSGTWRSAETGDSGEVSLRVQEFEGSPVVEVVIDHPFVVPGTYELVVTNETISLQADGQVVFAANLVDADGQVLDGSFDWGDDQGTWTATWQRALPELIDVGGQWQGVLQAAGADPVPFTLELDQFAEGGALRLNGLVTMPPEVRLAPVPLAGFVIFDETGWQFLLQTEPDFTPQLVLSGRGDRDPVQVPLGLLQVLTPELPFSQALLQMARVE